MEPVSSQEFKFEKVVLDDECWVDRMTQLPEEAKFDKAKFEELWKAHPEEKGVVTIYGRDVATPRWQQSYLKPYYFSGKTHDAIDMPAVVVPLFEWVKSINPGVNQCLVNWYQDGSHYIGAHSDDETQLIPGSDIFSFSYGSTREFYIHKKPHTAAVKKIRMPHNSVLVMRGLMQKRYKHSVPNTKKVCDRRINITFRCFK